MNSASWAYQFLRTEAKVPLHKTVVRPIFAYAAETGVDTAKTIKISEAAEMKTSRRILHLKLFNSEKRKDAESKK